MGKKFFIAAIIIALTACKQSNEAEKHKAKNRSSAETFSWQTEQTATEDLYIRDPFVVTDTEHGQYYLYRSAATDVFTESDKKIGGVEVFKSTDLKHWTGPKRVMTLPEDNWITGRIWAPEVHKYKDKYYMFATINTDLKWKQSDSDMYHFRGTQVFWSDSPEGPFEAFDRLPFTPIDEMALDGTFWEEDGQPYMIYCHEWVEVDDGEMKLQKLKNDLSAPEGAPIRLFCASAAPWSNSTDGHFVTDGPFIYKTKNGKLLMLWSSFKDEEYAIGIAESVTGRLIGPWKQNEEPLFSKDGGHGMLFQTLDGHLMLTIHSPNGGHNERAHFFELEDTGNTLLIKTDVQ